MEDPAISLGINAGATGTSSPQGSTTQREDERSAVEADSKPTERSRSDHLPAQPNHPQPFDGQASFQDGIASSTAWTSELRALQQRLQELEQQTVTGLANHADLASLHGKGAPSKKPRNLRFGKAFVQHMEKSAEETSQDRQGLGSAHSKVPDSFPRYMDFIDVDGIGDMPPEHEMGPREADFWSYVNPSPDRGMRPLPSLRPKHSRKLGPPSQWDAADADEWSSDDSISSRDFDYFRARLRGDFEWELDRLNLQRSRYMKHKEKKAGQHDKTGAQPEQDEHGSFSAETQHENKISSDAEIAKLSFVAWRDFKASVRRPSGPRFILDILVGEPDISKGSFWGYYSAGKKSSLKNVTTSTKPPTQLSHYDGTGALPERVRINSKELLKTLALIHGSELGHTLARGAPSNASSIVILRPFRILTYYDKEVRSWHDKLVQDLQKKKSGHDSSPHAPKPPEQDTEADIPVDDETVDGRPLEEAQSQVDDPDGLSTSEVTLSHLERLIEFQDDFIVKKQTYLRSASCSTLLFSDIWHFFKPGDIVISNHASQAYQIIKVNASNHKGNDRWAGFFSEELEGSKKSKHEEVSIQCVYIHFDGKQLGPVTETFTIKKFDGAREVASLPIYPLRFHVLRDSSWRSLQSKSESSESEDDISRQVEDLRRHLIARGRKFVQVAAVKHMFYAGVTIDTHDEVESQVMIDFDEAFVVNDTWRPRVTRLVGAVTSDRSSVISDDDQECQAGCCIGEGVHIDSYVDEKLHQDYLNSAIADLQDDPSRNFPSLAIFPRSLADIQRMGDDLTDNELLIMSYCVFGFVLRDRSWAKLDLEFLADVASTSGEMGDSTVDDDDSDDEDKSAFGQLVLPPGHKSMVLSLISQHFRNKSTQKYGEEQVDIVRGKGKGLIILLHGAPGVGKTTTAEGVAERFKKPLFQITCGDLGSDARQVESALQTNFSLANRWGCILLLDEADVFLAERRREDFTRNGLVAVFLRTLEYYAGILFLTTNRIGDFDEAFASRIHMSLYYPALSDASTFKVFKLNLELIKTRYKNKGRKLKIDEAEILHAVGEYYREHQKARWNGRQIRNACQTALALAEFDAQPKGQKYNLTPVTSDTKVHLTVDHLKTVTEAYLGFIEYLKDVHGTDAATHAKEQGLRALLTEAVKIERASHSGQDTRARHNPLHSWKMKSSRRNQSGPHTEQADYSHLSQHQEHPYTPDLPTRSTYSAGEVASHPRAAESWPEQPPQGYSPQSPSPQYVQPEYRHMHQSQGDYRSSPAPQVALYPPPPQQQAGQVYRADVAHHPEGVAQGAHKQAGQAGKWTGPHPSAEYRPDSGRP
ncbi:hypothetical protein N0V93_006029 [Gnomoniopsis smithogilvyi]|uniref:AAA+ ATPase domain-containing protein n=1 Tax=Gnomoniopsis smithogilvyi TaxID=1191159 RepID=A0A9W8YQ01_9PEZI|nr:hypothetical protein N0V93_006029 [Gnomoniopsis smithogilvyi]